MPRRSRDDKRRHVDARLQRQIDDLAFQQGPRGVKGGTGTDGRTVLHGTSNPTAGLGNDGDFYINTNTWSVFGPKTAGSWGLGISLVGPAGPNQLPVTSINTAPGRALNSTFQIHATRPAIVVYSVQLHAVLTALGTSNAKCELRSDPASPPTVKKAEVMHQIVLGVGLSVNQQSTTIANLVAFIAAGDNVRLVNTVANGGVVTLTSQLEIVF